jgi:hypothetical protein
MPFCCGRPALLLKRRCTGSSTKRPRARLAAVAPLMIRFVSLRALVTCSCTHHATFISMLLECSRTPTAHQVTWAAGDTLMMHRSTHPFVPRRLTALHACFKHCMHMDGSCATIHNPIRTSMHKLGQIRAEAYVMKEHKSGPSCTLLHALVAATRVHLAPGDRGACGLRSAGHPADQGGLHQR